MGSRFHIDKCIRMRYACRKEGMIHMQGNTSMTISIGIIIRPEHRGGLVMG
jgi:hypothetical protein